MTSKEELSEINDAFWPSITAPQYSDMPFSPVSFSYATSERKDILKTCATHVLSEMLIDNGELITSGIFRWIDEAIWDRAVFNVDDLVGDVINKAQAQFNQQMNRLKKKYIIQPDYDTTNGFHAYFALAVLKLGEKIENHFESFNMVGDDFFVSKKGILFKKYTISAYDFFNEKTPLQLKDETFCNQFQKAGLYLHCIVKYSQNFTCMVPATMGNIRRMQNEKLKDIKAYFYKTFKEPHENLLIASRLLVWALMEYVLEGKLDYFNPNNEVKL